MLVAAEPLLPSDRIQICIDAKALPSSEVDDMMGEGAEAVVKAEGSIAISTHDYPHTLTVMFVKQIVCGRVVRGELYALKEAIFLEHLDHELGRDRPQAWLRAEETGSPEVAGLVPRHLTVDPLHDVV